MRSNCTPKTNLAMMLIRPAIFSTIQLDRSFRYQLLCIYQISKKMSNFNSNQPTIMIKLYSQLIGDFIGKIQADIQCTYTHKA